MPWHIEIGHEIFRWRGAMTTDAMPAKSGITTPPMKPCLGVLNASREPSLAPDSSTH